VKRDRRIFEPVKVQMVAQQAPDTAVGHEVAARSDEFEQPAERPGREHRIAAQRPPHRTEFGRV